MIVSISSQTYYSIQHLMSADYFNQRANRVEKRCLASPNCETTHSIIKSYSASTLFTAVAFLEALINELFADAAQEDFGHLKEIDPNLISTIAYIGKSEMLKKASVLEKYEHLLKLAHKNQIPRNINPGQDISTVIRLRNELVHYKAEFFDTGTPGRARSGNFLDSSLKRTIEQKFSVRPGTSGIGADGWISAGCATWALKSAVAYADKFFEELDIKPIYEHVRPAVARKKRKSSR